MVCLYYGYPAAAVEVTWLIVNTVLRRQFELFIGDAIHESGCERKEKLCQLDHLAQPRPSAFTEQVWANCRSDKEHFDCHLPKKSPMAFNSMSSTAQWVSIMEARLNNMCWRFRSIWEPPLCKNRFSCLVELSSAEFLCSICFHFSSL